MPDRLGKFGTQKKAAFLDKLREGARRYQAAKEIGVSRETIRLHLHKDPAFAQAVDEAEMEANEHVEDALFKAATKGNVVACQVWLYNRCPDRWMDRRQEMKLKAELTGKDGGPVQHAATLDYEKLSDEELTDLERLCRKCADDLPPFSRFDTSAN